jgi:RNA polymerase sigma-70 factor (ECF subfamily)
MTPNSVTTDRLPGQAIDPGDVVSGDDEGPDPAERGIILAVQNGNHQAFGTLVSQYQARIFGLCLVILKTYAEAQEVAQDTFVRAFAYLDRFNLDQAFYPWLATIAVRLAQSRLKKAAQDMHRDTAYLAEPSRQGVVPQSPLEGLIQDEARRDIWSRVSGLSEGQRTVVFLFYREEMRIADVAMALGVTEGTVKTLLHRARKNLREHMSGPTVPDVSDEEL